MGNLVIQEAVLPEIPGGVLLIPKGYIDTTNASDVEKQIEKYITERKFKLAINLENVDFISSAGWGIFISEIRNIRENKGDLVLINMLPDVYDVYELMEFSSIIKSFDAVQDAVKYFKSMK